MSQIARKDYTPNANLVWNFPMDITWKSTNPFGCTCAVAPLMPAALQRPKLTGVGCVHPPLPRATARCERVQGRLLWQGRCPRLRQCAHSPDAGKVRQAEDKRRRQRHCRRRALCLGCCRWWIVLYSETQSCPCDFAIRLRRHRVSIDMFVPEPTTKLQEFVG